MSDPREPDEPDIRDERLGALLAVPPLDDVTRRRLVRGALERPAPRQSRMAAALSVAAAVAVGILVGVALVQGNEPSATTTAQGAPSGDAGETEAIEAAPWAADNVAGPITPLGDLGDVTKPADLAAAINGAFAESVGPGEASAVAGYPCGTTPADAVGLVSPSALGLGLYRGFPVTIFVGTAPDGRAFAVVTRQDDCTVLASVELPNE